MLIKREFYIDGTWSLPQTPADFEVVNPADEQPCATISLGSAADIDRAVSAARGAFALWSLSTRDERQALIARIADVYESRMDEMGRLITLEMGAPVRIASDVQAGLCLTHIRAFLRTLDSFEFEQALWPDVTSEHIIHEAIGVVALITPWNWPMNQISLKVIAALAAGCTIVLKPSEVSPLSALLFAEILDEAGVPKGVFNLVNGEGAVVGEALSRHRDVDMVSFTGSTRAGIAITKAAADTVKRVSLELGGKSPNIVFDDVDVVTAISRSAKACFANTGQSCNAPTRLLVQRSIYNQAVEVAADVANQIVVGDPDDAATELGPLASAAQFAKVQSMIEKGMAEGAQLVAGGPGRPRGLNSGFFARPTVFADVDNQMSIARDEIFGPVLSIIPFDSEEDAIAIANDSDYGLAAVVYSAESERAHRVARKLRAGMVRINGADRAPGSPFGGYKQSGNGREGGRWGLHEFLEVKAVSGWGESS
jgi:aldehyde dehydrogenase (NAD+)